MEDKKSNRVVVGLVQTAVSNDLEANLDNTICKIKESARRGAQIVCLQELFRTRYFPQHKKKNTDDLSKLSEIMPGELTSKLSGLAKELGVVIVVPLFERDHSEKYYNSVVVIDADGKLLETYRKIHIPHDPLFYEKDYFEPGNLGYRVYETKYAAFGVLICYDQWIPEAARITVLKGADIIFYPTAIGCIKNREMTEGDWHDAWETVQRGHAIANGVYIAAVNRVGEEEKLKFWGSSFVCDPFGKIIKRAGRDDEEIVIAELDLAKNKEVREGWGFFDNRRPDTYSALCDAPAVGKTPSQLGYQMPAEWEVHDAVWLSWPYDPDTFPDRVERVENIYLEIIKLIHRCEDVNLFVRDKAMKVKATDLLKNGGVDLQKVNFYLFDYADVWMRDYGPIFLTNKDKNELAMTNWIFNAWGNKYDPLLKDTNIPSVINQELDIKCFNLGFVLEGGSIDVNGCGTLLTTEQCLLNKTRNPNLNREEIEKCLKDNLGVRKIIWLKEGIVGDDTDGHIDDIARFVNPTTVLCAYEEDENDENYQILKENYEILFNSTDQDGKRLNVVKLPMPGPVGEEERLPASYANFYIGNTVVLVPVFGHANDQKALDIIQVHFPGRKVVGINCVDLVHGLGTIHCISQQQPKIR